MVQDIRGGEKGVISTEGKVEDKDDDDHEYSDQPLSSPVAVSKGNGSIRIWVQRSATVTVLQIGGRPNEHSYHT